MNALTPYANAFVPVVSENSATLVTPYENWNDKIPSQYISLLDYYVEARTEKKET